MQRRTLSLGVLAAPAAILAGRVLAPAPAWAQDGWDPGVTEFDFVKGDADAPVTVIEYASLTCGHCASFHTDTLPGLTDRYLDPGHVRLVFRQFPLNRVDLQAGMLARCLPEDRFFGFVDVLFKTQSTWAGAQDPTAALAQLGRTAGLSDARIEECLADQDLADRIVQVRLEAEAAYQISATPTFVIDGEAFAGNRPLSFFAEQLDPLIET
ncbi:MAG: DsbA family protein [Azospirillaceae bacterium]